MKLGQCIKIREFVYSEAKQRKTSKIVEKGKITPMKSLNKKLSQGFCLEQEINRNQSLTSLIENRKTMSLKKMLVPRDQLYEAKPYVFQRYNYQNYSNYTYRNPFKPPKFRLDNNIMKTPRKDINKGTTKNIQIVFCQNKFQEFVEKTNKKLQDCYQVRTKQNSPQRQSQLTFFKKDQKSQQYIMCRSNSLPFSKNQQTNKIFATNYNKNSKTTLSKCMHQFNTLQKLSYFMEKEQKLNEKYLLINQSNDSSKTVLLEIISHRFPFINQLKKKIKTLIFKTILGISSIFPTTKINIQQYLKFLKIFVYRDATEHELAFFVFNFLFRHSQSVNFDNVKSLIDMLPGSTNKHFQVNGYLQKIMRQSKGTHQSIFRSILNNPQFVHCVIDLIVGK